MIQTGHLVWIMKHRWDLGQLSQCTVLATGLTTKVQFQAGAMMGFFLFVAVSRLALEPTQAPLQ